MEMSDFRYTLSLPFRQWSKQQLTKIHGSVGVFCLQRLVQDLAVQDEEVNS